MPDDLRPAEVFFFPEHPMEIYDTTLRDGTRREGPSPADKLITEAPEDGVTLGLLRCRG